MNITKRLNFLIKSTYAVAALTALLLILNYLGMIGVLYLFSSLGCMLALTLILLRMNLTLEKEINKNRPLVKAPGSYLLQWTSFFYSEKDHTRVFLPIIGDMQEEWFKAYDQKRFIKARWIKIRYLYAFIQAMGINSGVSLVKNIFDAWHTSD